MSLILANIFAPVPLILRGTESTIFSSMIGAPPEIFVPLKIRGAAPYFKGWRMGCRVFLRVWLFLLD